jgi:hypothetical protein
MAGLVGVAVALAGLMVRAEEAAKCCSDETTAATACAGGCCDAEKCGGSETAIKQVSLIKEETDKANKKPVLLCPVSGKPADKEVTVAYQGGKISLCCAGCKGKFEKDTAKYAAKANYQLVASGQAKQKACPFSGKELNPETAAKVGDVQVCYCCNGCKGKVAKAKPEEQIELVFSQAAFEKGFAIKKEKKEEAK